MLSIGFRIGYHSLIIDPQRIAIDVWLKIMKTAKVQ